MRPDLLRIVPVRGVDVALRRRRRRRPWWTAALLALAGCQAAGPAPGTAPWRVGVTTGFGSSVSSELQAAYEVDPAVSLGALVRNRVQLGAVFVGAIAGAMGADDEIDVDLLEYAATARIAPIASGGTRPWVDLSFGGSHADATVATMAADGLLWGAGIGLSQYVSDAVAFDLGVQWIRADLDRGLGTEDDVEFRIGLSVRF